MKRAWLLIVLVCGVLLAVWRGTKVARPDSPLHWREAATRTLGEYVARHYPGKHLLIIANPFTREPGRPKEIYAFEKAGIHGVREGVGARLIVEAVAYPKLLPDPGQVSIDPHTTTPLSFLMAPDAFDLLAHQYPRCEIFVSLIGVPANLTKAAFWRENSGPKLALLLPDLRMVGDREAIRNALRSGKIIAMVLNKPGALPVNETTDNQAGFGHYYLLVTGENIDDLVRQYPRLF